MKKRMTKSPKAKRETKKAEEFISNLYDSMVVKKNTNDNTT